MLNGHLDMLVDAIAIAVGDDDAHRVRGPTIPNKVAQAAIIRRHNQLLHREQQTATREHFALKRWQQSRT
jgi:hypothetical protein